MRKIVFDLIEKVDISDVIHETFIAAKLETQTWKRRHCAGRRVANDPTGHGRLVPHPVHVYAQRITVIIVVFYRIRGSPDTFILFFLSLLSHGSFSLSVPLFLFIFLFLRPNRAGWRDENTENAADPAYTSAKFNSTCFLGATVPAIKLLNDPFAIN